jgi:hypothetical protein
VVPFRSYAFYVRLLTASTTDYRFCCVLGLYRVPISNDGEKLPSASTCFNTLKLPTYSSSKAMREKLLISIRSGAGFEMS